MNDYIVDDRMIEEAKSDKFIETLTEEERERIIELPEEEQLKVIDEMMNKMGL